MTAPFLRLTLTIEGETVIDRLLQGIEERSRDLTPVWPQVVQAFRAIEAQAFATEGGSTDAGAWPGLAESTIRDRVRHGFGAGPILQRTGKLQRALALGVGVYERMTPTSLQIQLGPEVEYYKYHQSNAPRKKLPRRAMVSLTADQRTQLMHPIRLYLTGRT